MTVWFRHFAASFTCAALVCAASPAAADGIPDEALARFEAPVCPGVIGLQTNFALAMVERIRENAEAIGLQLGDPDVCEANLVVAFVDDGQAYLQELNDSRSYLFGSFTRAERSALLNQTGPARSWVTTETRTRDGLPVGRRENLVNIPQANMWSAHSLIYIPTRQDIIGSMVLINRGETAGLSIAQLADYASLHGLAEFVPEAAADTASIQTLFADGDAAADGLTPFDMAYLERLYNSIPNLPSSARLEGLEGGATSQR